MQVSGASPSGRLLLSALPKISMLSDEFFPPPEAGQKAYLPQSTRVGLEFRRAGPFLSCRVRCRSVQQVGRVMSVGIDNVVRR
jgi:hypothetical protein